MQHQIPVIALDVRAFAQSAGTRSAQQPLQDFPRLMEESRGQGADLPVRWAAQGESRPVAGSDPEIWLHLKADARLPLICQRCLAPVELTLTVDRSFRFVADEDQAAALDEELDEDVLALEDGFDLATLIEDELLMELPLVPRHQVCPQPVKLEAVDPDFEAALQAKPNAFAALVRLRKGGDGPDDDTT